MAKLEYMAIMVHNAMENKRRHYHNSKHVFELCEGMNPLQTIASVFHDVIYYQIDGGYPTVAKPIIEDVVQIHLESNSLQLATNSEGDLPLNLCSQIFGFKPGQMLSVLAGFNEFLSAVLAARLLEPHLSKTELITVISCIESTIPFRGLNDQGEDCMSILAERIRQACKVHQLFNQEDAIEHYILGVMKDAVEVANLDVGGFAEKNPAEFLSATWQLIDESNAPLQAVSFHTLQGYRGTLTRMEKFLSSLNHEKVFHHYGNTPDEVGLREIQFYAEKNLTFSSQYMRAKLWSISIIEAIALETGGDCPISMFLGEIRCDNGTPDRIEHFLPNNFQDHADIDPEMLNILVGGRSKSSNNDLTASPLTAYCYRLVGQQEMMREFTCANKMFNGEISSLTYLKDLNPTLIRSIIEGCKKIAISRVANLDLLLEKLDR